ncbi:MAG: lipoyl synthase [Gammaproteobacteria bacterium]|nr:lipoyl synthase [Gammaproteobacteria bacterium]
MAYSNRVDNARNGPSSGSKYRTVNGVSAIRDGVKTSQRLIDVREDPPKRKPDWIRVRLTNSPKFRHLQNIVQEHNLATVCEESHCPNIGECWSHGTATIMLMGAVCTRGCRFCAVDTGNPKGQLDLDEPQHVADTVELLDLKYVVLTSVDRDDLPLGGAKHYANSIRAIKERMPKTIIEALTPDFAGEHEAIKCVVIPELSVFAHNIETVENLTSRVRDPRATYRQSLDVLETAKQLGATSTKSSIMLGLGETREQTLQTMRDLVGVGVDFLTLGQYLRPTRQHLPVERYVPPAEFDELKELGIEIGFKDVASGPLVRSSYRADRLFSGKF